ncbi:MAG: hypothetical protein MUP09_05930 [Thiovulaceae bacterium]|nr:hypothetical protein [Sulfurimonadaceae bacterium]
MSLTVKRLLKSLSSESALLEMLFVKRDGTVSRSQAQEFTKEGNIERLVESGLLTSDSSAVALDEDLRTFFEAILDSSDTIEIGNIGELLDEASSKIELYNRAAAYDLKQKYINRIDRILKKIPIMISKSLIKLHQHIHLTYKSADEHELKRVELQYYKEKLELLTAIDARIGSMLTLEAGFFKNSVPQATSNLYYDLKSHLTQMRISLVDLQRQVVDYINRVSPDVGFFKHVTRLKELKNAYEIKEYTNINQQVQESKTPLALTPRSMFSAQLEKEYASSVDFTEFVERWFQKRNEPLPVKERAEAIDASYLDESYAEEYMVDTDLLHLEFKGGATDLFTFVMDKEFGFAQDFEERLSTYCDLAGLYAKEYFLSDELKVHDNYEYLIIYPKEG